MDESNVEETTLLIARHGVAPAVTDNRRPYQKHLAVYLILASTAFERLAFYSLVINLTVNLQSSEVGWNATNSLTASFIFFGTSYISTLIFAVVSDAKLGRATTIMIGFVLYSLGYVIITLIANANTHIDICGHPAMPTNATSIPIIQEHCSGAILGTLIFTAIGVGAVQANMAVFGAEQDQESNVKSRYFDKYIVAVNLGGLFATCAVPFIQYDQNQPNNFFIGYLVAASLLVVGAVLFMVGYRFYIHIKPYDTVITKCIPVFINAFRTWRKYKTKVQSMPINRRNSRTNLLADSSNDSEDRWRTIRERSSSFLDFAKTSNNGKYVDRIVNDVKSLRRVIVVFLLLIPYWLIYYQIQTTFLLQGQHMKAPTLPNNEKMPVIWMSLGDQVAIIIGILIANIFVYKHLDAADRSISIKVKFVVGMILASLTMFIAATIELFRQNGYQRDNTSYSTSNLTIFAQLPQNICMGVSEVFAMVASFEFAYLAAPRSAQSLIMSLRFCSLGISSFIGNGYINLFTPTDENFDFDCQTHKKPIYYIYFYVLAALQLVFIIILLLCDRKFQILKLNPYKIDGSLFMGRPAGSSTA